MLFRAAIGPLQGINQKDDSLLMKKFFRFRTVMAFIIALGVSLAIVIPSIRNRVSTERVRLEQLLADKSIQVSDAVTKPIEQIHIVAAYIELQNGDLTNFDDLASTIVTQPYVRNLIVAPGGVVSAVYPNTTENQNVLGLDYFSDSSQGNREAVIASQERQLLLAGPFTTVVKDQAISGRVPVYLPADEEGGEEVFWGLVSITLQYPEVLGSANIDALHEQDLLYELWRINADTDERQVIMSNGRIDENDGYLDRNLDLLNAHWYMRLSPVPAWYQYRESWVYLLVALAMSGMVAGLIDKTYTSSLAKKRLEVMVFQDALTKRMNRQGLFKELNILVEGGKPFTVCYMDLNDFKQVNDQNGHAAGDYLLVEFAKRISYHLNDSFLFARISGDEFVIVHKTENAYPGEIESFWDAVLTDFKSPVILENGKEIFLSFCKGMAHFPSEANVLDDVINLADQRMYDEKLNK